MIKKIIANTIIFVLTVVLFEYYWFIETWIKTN